MENTDGAELIELERKYWQAIMDQDVDAAMALTDEPCIVAGAQGVSALDCDAMEQMMTGAEYTLTSFDIAEDDAQVRFVGDDVAIVAYRVHEELVVDGKELALDAADSSTWVRRGDEWRCALHTESLAGDAFGRDKKAGRKPAKA